MILGIALLLIWLILLIRFPRVMVPASGVLVALALLLAAGVGLKQWFDGRSAAQLEIRIEYLPEACDFGRPLQVHIENRGERTASRISWQLLATQPGYSSNLLDVAVTATSYQIDQPLASGESWQRCYAVPRLRSSYRAPDLEYRADRVRAEFRR